MTDEQGDQAPQTQVAFRLPDEQLELLRAQARKHDVSLSDILRWAVETWLEMFDHGEREEP